MDPEPGEEIFFHGHPSWRAILGFYLKGLLAGVLAGVIAGLLSAIVSGSVSVGWVIAVVLVVFLIVLGAGQVRRLQTTYTVTNQRLTIDTGILSRELHETRLERVQNVNSRQSLLDRLLRIGTVDFDTAGGAEYDFTFRGIAEPHQLVRTVDRALRGLQSRGEPHPGAGV
ncbi:MAG: PH domain-containing protein [Solirubrobacterales bacterium]|nr:PH domain-containing protein [Solirubrobacterales bacterium]MBV9471846.1 PH domain-containing protein [Solirubrobacterales bacterium]